MTRGFDQTAVMGYEELAPRHDGIPHGCGAPPLTENARAGQGRTHHLRVVVLRTTLANEARHSHRTATYRPPATAHKYTTVCSAT